MNGGGPLFNWDKNKMLIRSEIPGWSKQWAATGPLNSPFQPKPSPKQAPTRRKTLSPPSLTLFHQLALRRKKEKEKEGKKALVDLGKLLKGDFEKKFLFFLQSRRETWLPQGQVGFGDISHFEHWFGELRFF